MTRYRDDKSKVTDQKMQDAFTEGFREGVGAVQNPVIWMLSIKSEGTLIYREQFTSGVEALRKAADYIDTPGVEASILVTQQVEDNDDQERALEEGVIEGEVLEDVEIVPREREA